MYWAYSVLIPQIADAVLYAWLLPPPPSELTVSDKSFQIIRDIAMVYTVLFIAYILTRDLYIRGK